MTKAWHEEQEEALKKHVAKIVEDVENGTATNLSGTKIEQQEKQDNLEKAC